MATVESSGVAKAGLTTGVIGTSLAGLMALNNGNGSILGGLFGNNNQGTLMGMQTLLSQKDSEIAQYKAENYSDKVGKEVYTQSVTDNKDLRAELYNFIKPLADEAASNQVNIARIEEQIKCIKSMNEIQVANLKNDFAQAIALESERRTNGDNNLMCYVNATFVPGKLVMPKSSICPEVMARYNSWTAPTEETTGS